MPEIDFLALWGVEIIIGLLYLVSAAGMFISAARKNKPLLLVLAGAIFFIAGWVFFKGGWRISSMLLILAAFFLLFGIRRFAIQKQ